MAANELPNATRTWRSDSLPSYGATRTCNVIRTSTSRGKRQRDIVLDNNDLGVDMNLHLGRSSTPIGLAGNVQCPKTALIQVAETWI